MIRLEFYSPRVYFFRVDIDHSADYLTSAELLYEVAGAVHGVDRVIRIEALFKNTRRLCSGSESLG